MPTAGVTHHIVLNGVGYMLRQSSKGGELAFRRLEVPYTVPRRGELVGRSSLTRPGQDSGYLSGGVGNQFGEGQYTYGVGIDGRAGDGIRAATQLETVTDGATAGRINDWAEFNGTCYIARSTGAVGGGRLGRYNTGTGQLEEFTGGSAPTQVLQLAAFGARLWGTTGANAPKTIDTANTIADASGANCGAATQYIGRSGGLAMMCDGTGATRAFRWVTPGGGMVAATGWTTANESGDPQETVYGFETLGEDIYLFKSDGIYRVTVPSGTLTLERAADYGGQLNTSARPAARAVYQGAIYFRHGAKLYRFDGADIEAVTLPQSASSAVGEEAVQRTPRALAGGGGWLWMLAINDATTPVVELWAYNPTGGPGGGSRWEHLHDLAYSGSADVGSIHYSASAGYLLMNYYDGSSWLTKRMRVNASSDRPYANHATSGNYVYLAPIDGGLPDVQKRFHSVVTRGFNVGGGTSIRVAYQDGVSWTTLGDVTSNRGELVFPSGGYVASQLLLRLDLRGTSASTPCLREVGVTYDVMSAPLKAVEFEALLAPNLRLLDGTTEANPPTALLNALESLRAGTAVVDLTDPVVSATGGSALKVRVAEVTVEALASAPLPTIGGQYGWVVKVRCEVVG